MLHMVCIFGSDQRTQIFNPTVHQRCHANSKNVIRMRRRMSSDNEIGKVRRGQTGVGSQGVCIQISKEITHRVTTTTTTTKQRKNVHEKHASK